MNKYDVVERPVGTFTVTIYGDPKPTDPVQELKSIASRQFATLAAAQAWVATNHPDAGQLMK